MLDNGNFEHGMDGWTPSDSRVYATGGTRFNMSNSLKMHGALETRRNVKQKVYVKTERGTRETFTLSGWAKGYGLPNHHRDGVPVPTFRLRARVHYMGNHPDDEIYTADFSPCTEEWQFASVQFAKSQYSTVEYVEVYCDYDNNIGTAYFDDIQLVRDSIERHLSASDFAAEPVESSDETAEATQQNTPDTASGFSEAVDGQGNAVTETTFTDGEFGTIYRAFGYTPGKDEYGNVREDVGNNLEVETDARGYQVHYSVDDATSRNEEVTDRCGNKTAYEYDVSGKTTRVTGKDATDKVLAHVSYAYDGFDNMTEIARGDGMKYVLAYNAFHNLESISVDGKDEELVRYTYKSGNGRLKEIAYANGDRMRATYNSIGQMVGEVWVDAYGDERAHYRYTYDAQGNIVSSIDITADKEYNYQYEEGKLARATESDVYVGYGGMITDKIVVNTIRYYYDGEERLYKKVIIPEGGQEQTIYYENDDENTVVKFKAGGRTVTSHSKTDTFGRKVFDELQLGTGFVSRQFQYYTGEITREHRENAKLKSSPTTQLVSQLVLSGGHTLSYTYDGEERITRVVETGSI